MESNELDGLDQVLDRALVASRAQVPAGVEARVLGYVHRAESMRKRRRVFVLGTIALAVSLLIFVLVQHKPAQMQPRTNHSAMAAAGREQTRVRQVTTQKVLHRKARSRTRHLLKLSVFPSATPVTAEEQALLLLVHQDPGAADTLASLHGQSREPLHIEALNIVPLSEEQDTSGGNQ